MSDAAVAAADAVSEEAISQDQDATTAEAAGAETAVQETVDEVAPIYPPIDHEYNNAVPGAIIGTWADETDPALFVAPDKLLALLTHLRDSEGYDFLSSVTCTDYSAYGGKLRADYSERFDTVYHLYSTSKGGGHISLHVRVPSDDTVPSAISIYPGANLQEREVYDLYGIKFAGHPNLRRILLWEGFNGHPMRKDWKEAYHEGDIKPFKSRHPPPRATSGRKISYRGVRIPPIRKSGIPKVGKSQLPMCRLVWHRLKPIIQMVSQAN